MRDDDARYADALLRAHAPGGLERLPMTHRVHALIQEVADLKARLNGVAFLGKIQAEAGAVMRDSFAEATEGDPEPEGSDTFCGLLTKAAETEERMHEHIAAALQLADPDTMPGTHAVLKAALDGKEWACQRYAEAIRDLHAEWEHDATVELGVADDDCPF